MRDTPFGACMCLLMKNIIYHIALAITHSSFDIKPDADWIVEITSGVKRIVPVILTAN